MTNPPDNSKAIRVLHIGKYFPPHHGGMETYLKDLMTTQARQGLEVMAIVHSSDNTFGDVTVDIPINGGSPLHVVKAARWFNAGYVPISPFFAFTLRRHIKVFQPDVIHIHAPNASATWALLVNGKKIPWVIQWHSDILTPASGFLTRLAYRVFRLIESQLLSRSRYILATSKHYLAGSEPLQKYQDKCVVVPLGLDLTRVPAANSVTNLDRPSAHKYQLLYLGRLAKYKGVTVLLDALQEVPDTGLWIVGDGEEKKRLKDKVQSLGLSSRVELIGKIDEAHKWRFIKSADALVLPSLNKNEAFGMVLLEAGLFGKTLIASDIDGSGVGWVASQFKSHCLANPNDAASLAEAIAQSLYAAHELSGNTWVPSALDLDMSTPKISHYYMKCLGR